MDIFAWALIAATFLNSLLAGFLFAFAVVVMPGIRSLEDRDFLRSFQVIDRVIQDNQPLFMVMWLGSTLTLVATAALAFTHRNGVDQTLVVAATAASLLLVQLPTMTINIPLNKKVQEVDFDTVDNATAHQAREAFESQWNRWNVVRTIVSCVILAFLLTVLVRHSI